MIHENHSYAIGELPGGCKGSQVRVLSRWSKHKMRIPADRMLIEYRRALVAKCGLGAPDSERSNHRSINSAAIKLRDSDQ